MSWVSEMFGSSGDAPDINALTADANARQAAYYADLRQNYPSAYEKEKQNDPVWQAEQRRLAASAPGQQAASAASTNVIPAYSGPTAQAKLQSLLPQGFESTLIPSSAADSLIGSAATGARSKAQAFIDTMLKRGTITPTGRSAGLSALTAQDPGVKSRLTDISNSLLEGERAKLRGIAGEGINAGAGQSGEAFDPNPYYSRANTEAAQFLSAFPQSYTKAVGDAGDLYDTSGLGGAAGGVTTPRNVSFDPYAVEGGKLSTGLDESGVPPPAKKRSTAVF